ncbi:MAG: hypothetical protein KGL15_05965 [Acidobacteriota bacterium]|nr:hypothetical protein [Acidobacteriota bacterium]
MWSRVLEEARKAGPKKLAILAVLIVIAVLLAYGNHSSDNAASGRTLQRVAPMPTLSHHIVARQP